MDMNACKHHTLLPLEDPTLNRRRHQINVLSQILLLCLLHPLLLKSSGARVVFTTSDAHPWAETEPMARSLKETGSIIKWADDQEDFVNDTRYYQSKVSLLPCSAQRPDWDSSEYSY